MLAPGQPNSMVEKRHPTPAEPLNQCPVVFNRAVATRVRHQAARRCAAKPLLHQPANAQSTTTKETSHGLFVLELDLAF
jgi:hypothetical protein